MIDPACTALRCWLSATLSLATVRECSANRAAALGCPVERFPLGIR